MASYSVALAKHATLVGSTVDTVSFSGVIPFPWVEVVNKSTTATDLIYFTTSGTAPTVAGDDTYCLGAGQALMVPAGPNVKLISSSTPAYSVTGVSR